MKDISDLTSFNDASLLTRLGYIIGGPHYGLGYSKESLTINTGGTNHHLHHLTYYIEKLFQDKPYSFNYSILDEETGVTHSRDESSDEKGVIRGSYEVSQAGEENLRDIFQFKTDRLVVISSSVRRT